MGRSLAAVLGLGLAASPPLADAAQLQAGVSFGTEYTDNATDIGSAGNEVAETSVNVSPWLEIESEADDARRFRYQARYGTTYRRRFEAERNDLDHILRGRASYQLTPRTTARLQYGVDALQDLVRSRRAGADLPVATDRRDLFSRERRDRVSVTTSLERRLGINTLGTLSFAHSFVNNTAETRFDNKTTSLSVSVNRQFTQSLRLGLVASATTQESEDLRRRPGSSTDFFRAAGSFSYKLTETLVVAGSGGPLFVMPDDRPTRPAGTAFFRQRIPLIDDQLVDPSSCPTEDGILYFDPVECEPVPDASRPFDVPRRVTRSVLSAAQAAKQSESRDSITIATELSLTKRWRHASAVARFARRSGQSADLGTSTIVDTLSLEYRWEPERDWKLVLGGLVSRQESTNDLLLARAAIKAKTSDGITFARTTGEEILVESSNASNFQTMRFRARLEHAFSDKTNSFFEVSWRDQQFENQRTALGRDFRGLRVFVGLAYRFDPRLVRLPL